MLSILCCVVAPKAASSYLTIIEARALQPNIDLLSEHQAIERGRRYGANQQDGVLVAHLRGLGLVRLFRCFPDALELLDGAWDTECFVAVLE